jgi:hypothetical protein
MNKLKLYTVFLLIAGLLMGCSVEGGEGTEEDTGDIVTPVLDDDSGGGALPITLTDLPIVEDFGSYTNFNQNDTIDFFSPNYKALSTDSADANDPHSSLYYPTAGLYDSNGVAGGVLGSNASNQLWISNVNGDATLLIGNARFTIGQTRLGPAATDPKINTTSAANVSSWGELNLSQAYRISFCVVNSSGSGLAQVYLDNNTGGTSAASMHGSSSRLFSTAANLLIPGQRVQINVPGNATLQPSGTVLSTITELLGTDSSFLQFRVSSGGSLLIDDLRIEYQDAPGAPPVCVAGTATISPPSTPNPPALTAGDTQIDVTWSAVGSATSYDVLYNTVDSTSAGSPTVVADIAGTSTTLTGLANGTTYYVFVRAKNSGGNSTYSSSTSAAPQAPPPPEAPGAPDLVAGNAQITVSWDAVATATAYDVAYNTTNPLVPEGDVGDTLAGAVNDITDTDTTLTSLTNDTLYYVFVRAKNSGGNSAYSSSSSATPEVPLAPPDTPINLNATAGNQQITVTWDAASTGDPATAYDVAYNTIDDPDVSDGATVIADIATTNTTISSLTNGTTYYVFVLAKNAAGSSAYSASDSTIPSNPNGLDRTWTGSPDMAEATYASILTTTPPAGANNNVLAGTNSTVNGLAFFASSAGPLRHRSTVNEFNYNGSSYTTDVTTPTAGNAAPAQRVYIGVPVDVGRPAIIEVLHRNSSSGVTADSVKIVFIGSDGNVLCVSNAASNTGTTTQCSLSNGHAQTEVRIIYSREGTGVGGMHLTTITRNYQDN